MDRLDAMRVFVRVAELGSFSAAARQADLARSIVTRQIAALERRLGTKLMARSTRSLALTSDGVAYLARCREILALVDAAESELSAERGEPRGRIRASVPLSFGMRRLAPLLLGFVQAHPGVALDMEYADRRVDLIEEGFDLSIRITARLGPNEVARRIGAVRMHVVASPAYLERYGCPTHPQALVDHECLGYTIPGRQPTWPFLVDGRAESFPVRGRVHANNGDVLAEAAARGLGITCQPDFIVGGPLAEGRVVQILQSFPVPELGIHAMLPGSRLVPHRVRALIDHLQRHLHPDRDGGGATASTISVDKSVGNPGPGARKRHISTPPVG